MYKIKLFFILLLAFNLAGLSLLIPRKVVALEQLKFVALGDSITANGGFTNYYRTYVLGDLTWGVSLTNLGISGITSSQLLAKIQNDMNFRNSIGEADIITLEIGINDFHGAGAEYHDGTCGGADNQDCLREMVENFQTNWTNIVIEIKSLVDTSTTPTRTMDIYYPLAVFDQPPFGNSFEVINFYLGQMNSFINTYSPSQGIPVAQVHLRFNGTDGTDNPVGKGLVSFDGVHPTDIGNVAIATEFRLLGYAPLIKPCRNVNGDTIINAIDLSQVAQRFGHSVTSTNHQFDVNADKNINAIDLMLVAKDFGKLCSLT